MDEIEDRGTGPVGPRGITRAPPRAGVLQGVTLLLPVTMSVMGVVVLLPVMPALSAHFHALPGANFWIPVLLTIPSVMVVACAGLAGFLADLVGRKRLLLMAMMLYAAFGMAPFVLSSFAAILATRVCVGICEAAVLVVTTTMISDYFAGPERDRWLGWQIGVATVAATVLVGAGGILGSIFGWRGPFLIYGLTLPLALMVLLFLWEPQPDTGAGEHHGAASWQGFPWRRMAGICSLTIFASFLFYLVQVELSFALALRGIDDPRQTGTMLAIVSIGTIAGSVLFRFVSRQGVARLLFGEFALLGGGLVAMSHASDAASLVAFALISQIGAGLILPTLLTWAVRGLPFEHRGRGTGLWQGTFAIGQFLVSITVPAINLATGGLPASFGAIGWVTLGAAALAATAMRRDGSRGVMRA